MPSNADKLDAIARMERAERALKRALDKLDDLYDISPVSRQRTILKTTGRLNTARETIKSFIRHLKAAEVTVKSPSANAYAALDKAIGDLAAIEVETRSAQRLLRAAAALGDAAMKSRNAVSSRAT